MVASVPVWLTRCTACAVTMYKYVKRDMMCPRPTHTDFMAQSRNIITAGSNLAAVYVYVPTVCKVCCVHTVMCMLQAAACLGRGRRPLAALDYGTRNGLTRQGDQLVAKYKVNC